MKVETGFGHEHADDILNGSGQTREILNKRHGRNNKCAEAASGEADPESRLAVLFARVCCWLCAWNHPRTLDRSARWYEDGRTAGSACHVRGNGSRGAVRGEACLPTVYILQTAKRRFRRTYFVAGC